MKKYCSYCKQKDDCPYITIGRTEKCPENDLYQTGYEEAMDDVCEFLSGYKIIHNNLYIIDELKKRFIGE